MSIQTDILIERLKSDSKIPPTFLSKTASLITYYIIISLLLVWAWASRGAGFNPSFAQLASTAIGIMAACFAALTAIASSWPGQSNIRNPIFTLGALIIWVLTDQILQPKFFTTFAFLDGFECVSHILQFMAAPAIVIILLVYNAAPFRSAYSTFFATLSAGIIANIGMRILCGSESVLHDLVFHIAPSAIVVLILTKGFGTYFSWDRKVKSIAIKKLGKFGDK